jgi:hypothetical protein
MAMRYPDFTGAACAGLPTDEFYGDNGTPMPVKTIKKICAECPVLNECFEWGLHHERHGMWGGASPDERRKIRHREGITLKTPEAVFTASWEMT